jgi:ubiquitin carboxyl-terminal hydrolase 5/13
MKNLGNSCYLNSVMQVLFTLKDFQDKYYKHRHFYFDHAKDPVHDFNVQTAKLAHGLLSGVYSHEIPNEVDPFLRPLNSIRPHMFRSLIGHDHPEFGTRQQQDAAEFLEYYIDLVHKHCLTDSTPDAYLDPSASFHFQLEERIYCPASNQVRYATREDTMFRLNVPLDAAKNMHEVLHYNKVKEELERQGKPVHDLPVVRPIVPLTQAIARWAEPATIDDFKVTRAGPTAAVRKTQRFLTFPDYLLVQMRKYTYNDDWTPRKIDVSMDMPDELDITSLRAVGFQHGETPMPDGNDRERLCVACSMLILIDEQTDNTSAEETINDAVLKQLMDMGFSANGCKRALVNTSNNNIEAAMNWIFEHQGDGDFDAPLASRVVSSFVSFRQTKQIGFLA